MTMHTSEWVEWTEGRYKYRMRVTYGIDHAFGQRNNQDPYFSITGESEVMPKTVGRWREDCGGCMPDETRKRFPGMAALIPFHLMGVTTGPMHYEANSVHWWREGMARGWDSTGAHSITTPRKGLDCAIARGALPMDETAAGDLSLCATADELRERLRLRLPDLLAYFRITMARFGVKVEADDAG